MFRPWQEIGVDLEAHLLGALERDREHAITRAARALRAAPPNPCG